MIYHLSVHLMVYVSGSRVMTYITSRAGAAAVLSFFICIFLGPWIINKMTLAGYIDVPRQDGPDAHKHKPPTPSLGGLIILPAILLSTLLFARLDLAQTWVVAGVTAWMGLIGLWDDMLKKKAGKKGLIPRNKLIGQVTAGLVIGVLLFYAPNWISPEFAAIKTATTVPFLKNSYLNFAPFGWGILYIAMIVVIITGTTNSANLTDGIDGLAAGLVGIVAVGMAILSYVSGHAVFSKYLGIVYLPGSGELSVFCAAMVGACMGFLWWNGPPAKIYMGDVGSLALGGGLATVAILTKKELFLFVMGGLFVMESVSVLLQTSYFKWTRKRYGQGRRIFKMAPYHHHFQQLGWPDDRVVVRFWIIGIILLFLTLTSFKVR